MPCLLHRGALESKAGIPPQAEIPTPNLGALLQKMDTKSGSFSTTDQLDLVRKLKKLMQGPVFSLMLLKRMTLVWSSGGLAQS